MSGDPQNTNPDKADGSESPSSRQKKVPAKKVKAGSLKKKMTAKEQSAQFIQTARDLEADETDENFERSIANIFGLLPSDRS